MYDIKNYYEAKSAEDAVEALSKDPDSEIISGGTDVLIRMREGKDAGKSLVSIHNIEELKGVSVEEDGTVLIGPATSFSRLTNDPFIKEHMNVLGEAADTVGGPQIRNTGTIGGNICNGATSADTASTLLTFNAVVVLKGTDGTREIPLTEFYTGPGRTVRRQNEICIAIKIRKEDYEGWQGCYFKYGKRKAMEISTLGCAVRVKLSPDRKTIEDIRLAYGVAAPTPIRCRKAEDLVRGKETKEPHLTDLLADAALLEVNPRTSWRASKEFRLQLIHELCKRAMKEAVLRAGGELDA
jgi:xanthine dehydrogenase FAD-binding subunit